MNKKTKTPVRQIPNLPNLSTYNSALSARSVGTESQDTFPFFNKLNPYTPLSNPKNDVLLLRDSTVVTSDSGFNLNKLRPSLPSPIKALSKKNSISHSRNLTSTSRDFFIGYDTLKVNQSKSQIKSISPARKKEEVFNTDIWNDEQSSSIKKIVFFFQEMRTKISEPTPTQDHHATAFTQILTQMEGSFYNLLVSLRHTIETACRDKSKIYKMLESAQENLRNSEVNFKIKNREEYEMLEQIKKDLSQSLTDKEHTEQSHQILVNKLKSENAYLQQQLENALKLQDLSKISKELEKIKAESQIKADSYEKEIASLRSAISRVEIMYQGTKEMNTNLKKVNKDMEERLLRLNSEYSGSKDYFEKLREERDMYRERAMMQKADYEGLQEQLAITQHYFEKMRERYMTEKKKTTNFNEVQEESRNFDIEARALEAIKKAFEQEAAKINNKKDQANDVDLKQFALTKPSFLMLAYDRKVNLKTVQTKITNNFLATLRAIYDSKYNEFLYADGYRQVSHFSDFVYSWLGKFVFDEYTRKVRPASIKDPEPAKFRSEMIILLQNSLGMKLWECIVFKEFLDDVHTKDELLYFLHCRYLLFKGPQLNNPTSTFVFTHYVRLEWAEFVLDQLLGQKHSVETINLMKSKFKGLAKRKKNSLLIDSVFFLRVLLEEYKKEKNENFRMYKSTLASSFDALGPPQGKMTIPFERFKAFIEKHFPETYELEKAELYRKCWVYTNGNFDADRALVVLNEENFFVKNLSFPSIDVKLISKTFGTTSNDYLENIYDTIIEQYELLDEDLEALQEGIGRLGVEKFICDHQKFDRRVRTLLSFSTKGLHSRDILLELGAFVANTYRLNNIILYLDDPEKKSVKASDITHTFTALENVLKKIAADESGKLRTFEINLKAKKIQKFFKAKLSLWYKLMKLIIKTRLEEYYDEGGAKRFKTKNDK